MSSIRGCLDRKIVLYPCLVRLMLLLWDFVEAIPHPDSHFDKTFINDVCEQQIATDALRINGLGCDCSGGKMGGHIRVITIKDRAKLRGDLFEMSGLNENFFK